MPHVHMTGLFMTLGAVGDSEATPAWLKGMDLILKYPAEYRPVARFCREGGWEDHMLMRFQHQAAQYQQAMLSQWRERFSTAPPSTEPAGASSNRTLVVLIGQARGGEEAWSSLFQNVLDVSPRLASDCLPLHPDYRRQTKPTWRCCLAKRPTAAQSKLRCCTSERSLCGWCPSMRTG